MMSHQFEVQNRYHSQGLAAGGSALLDAINKGKVHLAKFILDAGESDVVNTRDFKGKTPLIRACYIKEEKTRGKAVDLLISKGANVNLRDENDRTALSYACEMRCNDVVRALVKNNVDPDIADNIGNTPLMYSAMVGNDTAIDILIRSFRRLGLDVDHVNGEGLTALLIAAKSGFIECATLLAVDGRANIALRDTHSGHSAEQWARMRGCNTPEVLPFSEGQLRLSRCISLYTPRRAIDPDVDEGISGSDGIDAGVGSELLSDESTSPSKSREGMISGVASSSTTVPASVAAVGCHFGALSARQKKDLAMKRRALRYKRNSLPIIKFQSSLDSPSGWGSGDIQKTVASQPQLVRATAAQILESLQRDGPVAGSDEAVSSANGSSQRESRDGHVTVSARRSRELARADTEISRSVDTMIL